MITMYNSKGSLEEKFTAYSLSQKKFFMQNEMPIYKVPFIWHIPVCFYISEFFGNSFEIIFDIFFPNIAN